MADLNFEIQDTEGINKLMRGQCGNTLSISGTLCVKLLALLGLVS